jgi:acyl carrier protein
MTTPALTASDARAAVATALRRIVPNADLDALGDDAPFRAELELDSLDFLSFVEMLSEATGLRIDEDDYPRLATMASSVELLTSRSGAAPT